MTSFLKKKEKVSETGSSSSPTLDSQSLQQKIASCAYELFLKRGQAHGHDLEDWLEAEREVLAKVGLAEKKRSQTSGPSTSRQRSAR
jgi:hypothetical protein